MLIGAGALTYGGAVVGDMVYENREKIANFAHERTADVGRAWDGASRTAGNVWNAGTRMVGGAMSNVTGTVNNMAGTVSNAAGNMVGAVGNTAQKAWDGAGHAWNSFTGLFGAGR